ncbi:substrate-binding domain-containing protein [Terrisporobacter sp.]
MSSSLNVIEVAKLLNIAKNTVYEMIKRGELPSYKVGRKIRIDRDDIENYINNQKKGSSKTIDIQEPTTNINFSPSEITSTKLQNEEIIISGQDIVLDILNRMIEQKCKNIRSYRSNIGSYNGLYEMYNGRVSISSSHLWDYETDTYNTNFVKKLLPGIPCILINLAYRTQGFYVQKGNPKNIKTWEDLNKKNITMVNREKGSGIRILLDSKIKSLNLSQNIIGYENEETSHLAVASYIARQMADVGIGNEKVSKQVDNIDFIPLQKERYDLVIKKSDLNNPTYKSIINIISSEEFKNELEGLGGYDLKDIGKIIAET